MSDEQALTLVALKTKKAGQHDHPLHAAAYGYKTNSAVGKNYSHIIWSVGIVHKVILRWRRKGRGLRGLRPQGFGAGISMVDAERKEDDYDFLKEGRKQTED
ncbi:UNVERIFIED_CONTAM: Calmodulin-binding transcription activator 2 [Sesamum latifolium]|uniref:Calmodulin-binding transcription activator 2 n=1 Tax=Sesamum latifolium TaxID=2727402 RepID=A0AAW2WDR0_9LAMI